MSKHFEIGDVFEIGVAPGRIGYFQYVANDLTQLNSQVIRVFKEQYDASSPTDIAEITRGSIDFHSHVFLRLGVKRGYWHKVGHVDTPGETEILFRNTNDYGNPKITVSENWHLWKPNEPFRRIGKLHPEYQHAEIGVVVPPSSVIHRMKEGRYDFVYPDY